MKRLRNAKGIGKRDITEGDGKARRVVGYVRVSTDMQAADGLSLDVTALRRALAFSGSPSAAGKLSALSTLHKTSGVQKW